MFEHLSDDDDDKQLIIQFHNQKEIFNEISQMLKKLNEINKVRG